MKGLRKIPWTAKETNEWSKDTVKARKLAYYEETRERDDARNAGEEGHALDNIKTTLRDRGQGQMKKVTNSRIEDS